MVTVGNAGSDEVTSPAKTTNETDGNEVPDSVTRISEIQDTPGFNEWKIMGEVTELKPTRPFAKDINPFTYETIYERIMTFIVTDVVDGSRIQIAAYGDYADELDGKFKDGRCYIFSGGRSCLGKRHPANPTNHPLEIHPDGTFTFEGVNSNRDTPALVFTNLRDIKNMKSGLVNTICVIVGSSNIEDSSSHQERKWKLIDKTKTVTYMYANSSEKYSFSLRRGTAAIFKDVTIEEKNGDVILRFTPQSSLLRSDMCEMAKDLTSWFEESRKKLRSDSDEW